MTTSCVFTRDDLNLMLEIANRICENETEWQELPVASIGSLIGVVIEKYAHAHGLDPAALAIVIADAVIEINKEN